MNEISLQATRYRRIAVVDIETISTEPSIPKGALDGLTAQVICIGLMIDDGVRLTERAIVHEDEFKVLTEFWATIQPTDVLVGHNALEFDFPILRQRSWIHGVRPSRSVDLRRYYTADVKDTMCIWTNWGFKKGVTLDALATALGVGQKTGHGVDVPDWWAVRDLRSIGEYCLQDCWLTYQVFCKLTYQEPRVRQCRREVSATAAASTREHVSRCRRRVRPDSPVLPDVKLA
jgi:DNA polymerase elongation subunit (family B)